MDFECRGPGSESEAKSTASEEPASPAPQEVAAVDQDQLPDEPSPEAPAEDLVQRNEVNVAMKQSDREAEYEQGPLRRPHGRALPQ